MWDLCSDWLRPRAGDAKGPVGKLASHRRVLSTSCMWTLRMLLEFPYGTHQASQSSGKGGGGDWFTPGPSFQDRWRDLRPC